MAKKEKLDYPALIKKFRAEGPGQLYLLWGEEDYLREQFADELRRACLGDSDDSFDCKRFDAAAPDMRLVQEAVDAMPFLSERLYVELRGFDINKCKAEDAEQFKALIADLADFCTLVVLLPTGYEPDGRLGLYKAIKKHGQVIEFTAQEQTQLLRWIQRRAESAGKKIARADAEYLIFNCGALMSRLGNEISKLTHYAREETITRADIDAVTDRSAEASVFRMTDALAARDYNTAAGIMAELLGKKEHPIMLLAMIGKQLRQLYTAKVAQEQGLGRNFVAEVCDIRFDFLVRKLMDAARGFSLQQLSDAVALCAETDYAMKHSSADDEELLCDLLLKIAVGGRA